MLDSPLVTTGLPVANAVIMCGIGLTLGAGDFARIAQRPKAVAIGLAGQYVLLPLIGFAFGMLFRDSFGYAVGFVLLAACPSANVSNVLVFLGRGNVALAVTFTAIFAVASLVSIPLLAGAAIWWFGGEARDVQLPVGRTMAQLAVLVLLPVLAGMAFRRLLPGLASRVEPWIGRVSLAFLLLLIATIVAGNVELVRDSLARLGMATLSMCVAAMACGLLMARLWKLPAPDAIAVGMEVGVQNCMLAMLVALTILRIPEMALPAATYGLLMFLPAFALAWLGRRAAARGAEAG